MSAQTSYTLNLGIALAGMIADLANSDIISRSVETTAGIDFAVAVSRGTNADRQIVLGGDDTFLGVTIRSVDIEGTSNGAIIYAKNDTAGVMRKGYVWAPCPTGCVPGDVVNYDDATGILDSGAAGAGETDIAGATWETTASAGELAVLRLS